MASIDEDFINRLRETFKVEAEEHLQAISQTLLSLDKLVGSPPTEIVESVYREAHSLKGAARAVDYGEIETICQAIESVFSSWKREIAMPSPEALDALHRALDMIHGLLDRPGGGGGSSGRDAIVQSLGRFQRSAFSKGEYAPAAPSLTPPPPESPVAVASVAPTSPVTPRTVPEAAPQAVVEAEKPAAVQTVRISLEKLDARLWQAEDMLSVKSMAAERSAELRDLTIRFSHWQREWAKIQGDARVLRQAMERREQADAAHPFMAPMGAVVNFLDWNFDYFRTLEEKLRSLSLQADQERHVIGKRVDDLLEDSRKLLMLSFSTLSGVFPKVVRDLCREQGKEAELVIRGGDVEIDKRILEEMKDAMMHILRNSVDHGIEAPAERRRLGKPERATITIAVSNVTGNNVEILVTDDGAGIDVPLVKQSAVRHGIISPAEATLLGDADALDLVFHSEVSTSAAVTKISGRGLGMAIVRAKCEKLGGKVLIESSAHGGTSVRIVLPLTLATFRGVLVTAGERSFVIPTVNVERVLRVRPQDVQTAENRQVISVQNRAVSLVRLDVMLELPSRTEVEETGAIFVVLLHSAEQRLAVVVDQVLREEEVLVKPLRYPLVRVRNISGVTMLGSGKTVPILNVADLMLSARSHGAAPAVSISAAKPVKAPAKKILVAEDSITSRMLLKAILEGAGFTVRTAVDGVDAFTALREERFDLIVSDVEMPRMNGFDLAARIRADKRLGELPVVLVSALESREQRERGIDAGANAYIVKSSFDQSNLLEAVRRLV